MSVQTTRRPAAALAVAALLSAGLAAPASASPWSEAWERLSGWFSRTPLGALWGEPSGAPRQVVANQGVGVDPSGTPINAPNEQGAPVDPNVPPTH